MLELKELKKRKKSETIIPLFEEISSDTLTPVLAFLKLKELGKKAFLLESVEGGERIGRYCFLGVNPVEKITVKEKKLLFEKSRKVVDFKESPFPYLKKYFSQFKTMKFEQLPPFTGGAVGYVGYESINYIEKMPAPKDFLFSDFPEIQLMVFQDVLAFDRVMNKVIVISNINLHDSDLDKGYIKAKKKINDLIKILKAPYKDIAFTLPSSIEDKKVSYKKSLGRKDFENNVRKIKSYIKQGDIFQCVLSDQFEVDIPQDPFLVYRTLRASNPAPYLFYLCLGDTVLTGASPETLVKVQNGTVETCPIAGTRPRGKDIKEDKTFEKNLLASVKEKAEHLMLVDLGRNDIGRVSKPGTVEVSEFMQVHRFSNVMHLVSLVKGKLKKGLSALDALIACFPAGTLSGAPKIRAMEIINDLEKTRRGPYGGAIVYYDYSGSFDSCIIIRSLLIKKKTGLFQAGAGIVADSNPAKEYDEVLHKSSALRKAIAHVKKEKK